MYESVPDGDKPDGSLNACASAPTAPMEKPPAASAPALNGADGERPPCRMTSPRSAPVSGSAARAGTSAGSFTHVSSARATRGFSAHTPMGRAAVFAVRTASPAATGASSL